MSDITLEALKLRERELELDAVLIRGRIEEVRNMIAVAQHRRGGRPRKGVVAVINTPDGPVVVDEPETEEVA